MSNPLNSPSPVVDRDRTVSRRSEPSSRTALMSEQLNPWDLLQPRDAMSRHRGINPRRRCELLARLICYPRRTFYPMIDGPPTWKPPGHYVLLSYLLDLSISQSSSLVPLHSTPGFQSG